MGKAAKNSKSTCSWKHESWANKSKTKPIDRVRSVGDQRCTSVPVFPNREDRTRPAHFAQKTQQGPTVRDRVVQRAIVNVIEPILDHQFHERSFGFRHERGAHDALRIVEQKLQEGYVYVVDADLKGFPFRLNVSCVEARSKFIRAVARTTRPRRFDTIPKDRLLTLVQRAHFGLTDAEADQAVS